MPPIALSKTKLLSYLQCPRRLWLEQYSPELEDESAIDEAALETGRAVGELARQIYGGGSGHLVSHNRGLRSAVTETAELLAAGGAQPIFEATFDHDGVTVLVDVLDRANGAPRIVEVKASTSVKPHFLADCAIQAWTLREIGIDPASTSLALIDNDFVYRGNGDYAGLFREVEVTADIESLVTEMPATVAGARATLDSLDEPEQPIGVHCQKPSPCPFFEHCAPEQGQYPITGLGGRKEMQYELMRAGRTDIRELAESELGNETQQLVWRQTVSGEAYVSPELKPLIAALDYPRYYLDFETIAFAVPIWPETKPFEALPFQWSCHIDSGNDVSHTEFLDLSGEPPMRRAAEALIDALGATGPIIVYTPYELRVLTELAARFPDLAAALNALAERLVDLHPIAKAHYYHPDMRGSWSIKAILPTIGSDADYDSLDEVRDGEAAQAAFSEAIDPASSSERRDELRQALLAYCRLDSLAMLKLAEFFGR